MRGRFIDAYSLLRLMNAPDTAHECGDFVMQRRSVRAAS
jgi:hypothetical protein